MSKFKIGDRVRVIKDIDFVPTKGLFGTVTALSAQYDVTVTHDAPYADGLSRTERYYYDSCLELVKSPSDEIHITTKGSRVIAIQKQNGKVINRAEAVCAPDDTFDFAIGAQLAFDRLTKPEVPCEAPAEVKPELIKLYCVKDYEPNERLAKGKIYEIDSSGYMHWNKGLSICTYKSADDFFKTHPQLKGVLVPLVSRPAKVGEWVLITSDSVCGTEKGEICEVVAINDASPDSKPYLRTKEKTIFGYSGIEPCALAKRSDYLVLDGYQPEPEYYSGKVVCVEWSGANYTPGKVYNVVDGYMKNNFGGNASTRFKTLDDVLNYSGKFIELVEG